MGASLLFANRVDFCIFSKNGFVDNYFFLPTDVFFVIGFGTGMVSGVFSLFEIEN